MLQSPTETAFGKNEQFHSVGKDRQIQNMEHENEPEKHPAGSGP